MGRESRRRSSFGAIRLAAAAGAMALLTLAGCAIPHETRDLGVVARDCSSGDTLEGVRIFRHVDKPNMPGTPADAVATTDAAGLAVFAAPRLNSKWLVMRDGYEPMLVDLREGGETPETGPHQVVVQWADVMTTGMLDLPLTPITYRTIWVSVVDAATGSPVGGATVLSQSFSVFDREHDGVLFGVPVAVGTQTDAYGLAMVDLPSAATCVLSVEADGHAATTLTLDPDSDDGVAMHTTVPLEAYRYEPTRVVVIDRSTGLPLEGATIRVGLLSPTSGELKHDSIWTTDAEGMAIVMKPSAGLGTMVVEYEGRAQTDFRVLEIHAPEFDTVAIGADDLD